MPLVFPPCDLMSSSDDSGCVSTRSHRLHGPSCSASSCSRTSNVPAGSASSTATPRAAHLPELLIDCEEDRALRAVLVGMLREADR